MKKSTLGEKILWAFAILVPFSEIGYLNFAGKRIGYCDFLIAILFIVWLIKFINKRAEFCRSYVELSFAVMLCVFLLSIANSAYLINSIAEFAGLIYLMVVFMLVINMISTLKMAQYLLAAYVITATILSVIGLACLCAAMINGTGANNRFLLFTDIESMAHHFPRIKLAFESPNMFLSYLHVALVAGAILFLMQRTSKGRALMLVSISILLTTAFFTGSRRFAGLLLSLFLIMHWFTKGRAAHLFKRLLFFGFILFLLASLLTTVWLIFPMKVIREEAEKTIALKLNYAYSVHYLQIVTPIKMLRAHPFIGVGLGTYYEHFKDYVDWQWLRTSFGFEPYPIYKEMAGKRTLVFDPHSMYLGTLAETGVIGFMGLCCFLMSLLIFISKRFQKYRDSTAVQKVLAGCVLAGLIGFLLNGVITDILSMRHFWFMMALGFLPISHEAEGQVDR